MIIKVLGPGCTNCVRLEERVRTAITELGKDAQVIKVTDYGEIAGLGVMATPGLMIDGQLVTAGRVPSQEEITGFVERGGR